ncbi:MAG: rRNA maturation RNase YbeY [Deltaproteobacteria bacterium]|jgi:probable rRNA maturation factor|nr:rRNA maturation RNase YbeY [Deltaproteobacteria bacterium]
MPLSRSELKAALELMAMEFDPALPEHALLELTLISDARMAELNESYLHCAGPTNILAFPAQEAGRCSRRPLASSHNCRLQASLGWIALSPFTLRREAFLYKQNLPAYTLRLLAHGFAHLLGYEHGELMDTASDKAALAAQRSLKGHSLAGIQLDF